MTDEIRLTQDIHNYVRGHLSRDESLKLLDEVVESEEWVQHLEIDMLLYEMARKKREKVGVEPPVPVIY